ncbi:hypothetical protein [Streptomyces sp. CBMA156]|uniref:hypothetical protein n=1 Tax=Streptomyces sp. CBMA156 TaxID=1930280 RepID=UPI0016619D43|nr:hypothetical protein [Streptomyces sp. CBMA156]MBD0675486.1 hypothetical protein [Streptomyces sp. CBMA156]
MPTALDRLNLPTRLLPADRTNSLRPAAIQWRADLDPATGEHRAPTPPGTADRLLLLLLLLRRMAADAPPTDQPDSQKETRP